MTAAELANVLARLPNAWMSDTFDPGAADFVKLGAHCNIAGLLQEARDSRSAMLRGSLAGPASEDHVSLTKLGIAELLEPRPSGNSRYVPAM